MVCDKAKANPPAVDQGKRSVIIVQLLPQAMGIELDGTGADLLPPPDTDSQLRIGDKPVAIQHQAGKEAKLSRVELNSPIPQVDLVRLAIQVYAPGKAISWPGCVAAKEGADTG